MAQTKIFLSYSWDDDTHRAWVQKLADELDAYHELHVILDSYDLDSSNDKNFFMEKGLGDADFIIIVATKEYKRKADQREGGVGIETYLATAKHWKGMLEGKATKLVVVRRDKDAVPAYMDGHFYVDFSEEIDYLSSFDKLISHIKGGAKVPRPVKKVSLYADLKSYNFTRTEDIIKIGHKNRKCLISAAAGTDFSGGNRIKFEFWETRSPQVNYFLSISDNVNIGQTLERAAAMIQQLGVLPRELTMLRGHVGGSEQASLERAFERVKLATKAHIFTYRSYMWDYCIDEALRAIEPPPSIKHYTDQTLVFTAQMGEVSDSRSSAGEYFGEALQKSSNYVAHLVVAGGGMGKTSLCLAVAAHIHKNIVHTRTAVVLIQSENIRKYIIERGGKPEKIDSIYDLYELYAKYQSHENIFDRATFDLAVACGNLVVIIDGLDELASFFQEKFNLDSFLESLAELHSELGSSNVLLTTRSTSLIDRQRVSELNVAQYEILGFDEVACRKYLSKRFKGYDGSDHFQKKVLKQIEKINLQDSEDRIVPFFVDIAATVIEDGISEAGDSEELELDYSPTPYPSNNELTDHIVHSVFRREETRHGLAIPCTELVNFFTHLVADYGDSWPISEVRQRLDILYEAQAESLYGKIELNPLLVATKTHLELKYGFLTSYFEVLLVFSGIHSISGEQEFLKVLSKLSVDAPEFKEVRKFYVQKRDELSILLPSLIKLIKGLTLSDASISVSQTEKESARRAISTLISIYSVINDGSSEKLNDFIESVYCEPGSSSKKITGLYLQGDLPPLDFSNKHISYSRFKNYRKFLASKFSGSFFSDTVFEKCGNSEIKTTSLEPGMLDPSCDRGDLNDAFHLVRDENERRAALVEVEAKKFLNSFFRGDRFRENRKSLINFSSQVSALSGEKFNRLISNGYISIKSEKAIDTFYEIEGAFKESVRRYLSNNYVDAKLRKFLEFLRGV